MRDETKPCATCGRAFGWRRRWADRWPEIRFCSARCRRGRPGPLDRSLEQALLQLLEAGPRRGLVGPSEAIGALQASIPIEAERARCAARRLAAAGRVEIVQGGRAVDPSTARGPFHVRRIQ